MEAPEEVHICSLEGNVGLLLIANLLFLTLTYMKSIDPVSLMLGRSIMFTVLKGLGIFSRPSIPRVSLSFFGNLACFGVTVRLSMSKSYWVISEMELAASTLGARYSATSSISLT